MAKKYTNIRKMFNTAIYNTESRTPDKKLQLQEEAFNKLQQIYNKKK